MDHDSEIAKAKWLMIAGLLFLVSGCLTYTELNLWLRGRDGEATLTKAFISKSRRGGSALTVEYEFADVDGNRRKDQQSLDPDTPVPHPGGNLPIRYTPGAGGSSRVGGQVRWGWIALFGGSLLFLGFGVYKLVREANDDQPRRK